jgi:hypothetical protein
MGVPRALLQYATLQGSGNTIIATRVPVVTEAGKTIYKDIAVQFDVDSGGNLALSAEFPKVLDSQPLLVSSFLPGNYVGPGTLLSGKALVTVSGPGATDGGATAWSLTASSDASVCTFPASATWYVGPIEGSPVAARLRSASITSTAWSYGVAGASPCTGGATAAVNLLIGMHWDAGTLIGVSQTGDSITIASFTRNNGDRSAPVDQITYRLMP